MCPRRPSLRAIALVSAGLAVAAAPLASIGEPETGLAASPWPKFGGNNQNAGRSDAPAAKGIVRWTFPTEGIVYSPSIGTDGTVYAG